MTIDPLCCLSSRQINLPQLDTMSQYIPRWPLFSFHAGLLCKIWRRKSSRSHKGAPSIWKEADPQQACDYATSASAVFTWRKKDLSISVFSISITWRMCVRAAGADCKLEHAASQPRDPRDKKSPPSPKGFTMWVNSSLFCSPLSEWLQWKALLYTKHLHALHFSSMPDGVTCIFSLWRINRLTER